MAAGAIIVAGTTGTVFGYSIPRLVHRLGWDPKIASGPAVLARTDVAALFGYLWLSTFILA